MIHTRVRTVHNHFPALIGTLPDAIEDPVEQLADTVVTKAKRKAPASRRRRLKKSIQKVPGPVSRWGRTRWFVGTDLWRAFFVEFGTRTKAARPFLYPAAREAAQSRSEILRLFAERWRRKARV
jgi:hypothetical protein